MSDDAVKIKVREESEISSASGDINWQVEEQPITPNSNWLWALAIVGFAVIIFSILLKNYLLIVIVALSAFIVYARKFKKLETHDFRINSKGITIDGKFYSYESFESFWIFPDEEMVFRRKHHFIPLLTVPFHGYEEQEIRKIIENYLPESEEEESFLDLLQKKFF